MAEPTNKQKIRVIENLVSYLEKEEIVFPAQEINDYIQQLTAAS